MMNWQTVDELLRESLLDLMQAPEFENFRLVGGTALSLHRGHRMSIDIDLFTDQDYGTVDFDEIERYLFEHFAYVDPNFGGIASFGKSYLIGTEPENTVKLDVYYSNEKFLDPAVEMDGVRMASVEDIIAMKLDVMMFGGRKKDFWDLHELLPDYSIADMIALHERRCEYTHDAEAIRRNFTDFTGADLDFDPICLRNRQWVFIKEDIEQAAGNA